MTGTTVRLFGSGLPCRSNRTKGATLLAVGLRPRPLLTVKCYVHSLVHADSTAMTWRGRCCGTRILATWRSAWGLEKVRLQPCTVIPSLWCGIIRGSHLLRRSTSGRAKSVGGLPVKRLRHGRLRFVVEYQGRVQVITSATDRVRSYDIDTGDLVWEGAGVTPNAIPTPVTADGIVYLMSGYRGNQLYAVDLSKARGDITGTDAIVWSLDRDTPYVPSPVLHDGILYFTKSNSGILSAHDAKTGRKLYGPERLPGIRDIYASPVVAGGYLYVTSRDGVTLSLKLAPNFVWWLLTRWMIKLTHLLPWSAVKSIFVDSGISIASRTPS